MKKLGFLIVASTMLLTGCISKTSQGGEGSLTNKVSISEYQLSDNVKSQISKGDQVIITELVTGDSEFNGFGTVATKTTNFIHSATAKMNTHGYKIVSTDTNGMGQDGVVVFVTLVFEKEK